MFIKNKNKKKKKSMFSRGKVNSRIIVFHIKYFTPAVQYSGVVKSRTVQYDIEINSEQCIYIYGIV